MELRDYLSAVKQGRWLIAAFVLLALIAGVVFAFTQTAEYQSTTKLYVAAQVVSKDPDELSQRNAIAQQRALSYVQVLNGNILARQISRRVGFKVDPEDVSVIVVPGTVVVEIAVIDSDPDRARDVAAAYADAAPAVVRDLERPEAGGYEVVAQVIDKADVGEPIGSRSPVFILVLCALIGLGAGAAAAALWWAVRRELDADGGASSR